MAAFSDSFQKTLAFSYYETQIKYRVFQNKYEGNLK